MKTAMQEMIYDLKLLQEKDDVKLVNIESIISYANDKLEKEKEQIINAHTNAYLIGEDDISVEDANKASEQYYNQTYNQ